MSVADDSVCVSLDLLAVDTAERSTASLTSQLPTIRPHIEITHGSVFGAGAESFLQPLSCVAGEAPNPSPHFIAKRPGPLLLGRHQVCGGGFYTRETLTRLG